MGKFGLLGFVYFLVEGTGASVLVLRLHLVFLVGSTSFSVVFWGVCELSVILSSLSANGWDCAPLLLVVWHRVSSTVACCSLSGAGF